MVYHWQSKMSIKAVWTILGLFQALRVTEFGARLLDIFVVNKKKYWQLDNLKKVL
jgi:hypothetical protein